jgi:tetratricopeptide (TPR) repeat protein
MKQDVLAAWKRAFLSAPAWPSLCGLGVASIIFPSLLLAHPELDAQIDGLNQQIVQGPSNATLYCNRANLYRQDHEWDLALMDLATAERLSPLLSMVSLGRAQTLLEEGRPQAALDAVQDFLKAEPAHGPALLLRAHCRQALHRLPECVADYNAALSRLAQPAPDLFLERARVQAELGQLNDAVAGLVAGIALLGNVPALQLMASGLEEQGGRFDLTLQRMEFPGHLESKATEQGKTGAKPGITPLGSGDPILPTLTRGPYLQLATPDSIIVRWRTDLACDSRVLYGTSLSNLDASNVSSALVTEHVIQLTNLSPQRRYFYAVGSTDVLLAGPGPTNYLMTHPPAGAPRSLHVWVIGDAGTATLSQRAVRDAFYALNGTNHVDALLQLGDNAYDEGWDTEYQAAQFDVYGDLLQRTVTWPTIGNHDTYSADADGMFPYLDIFNLPMNAEAGGVPSGTERYYSFDLGQTHFVCLDSMTSSRAPDGAMAQWLRADLAANTNRWLIAYWHHPPYSEGLHNSDTELELMEMRQNILPIVEAGGADLVLCGHSHNYERSYLLDGHYGLSGTLTQAMVLDHGSGRETNGSGGYLKPEHLSGQPIPHAGTVYIVAGCAGQTNGGPLDHPAMYVSLNQLGSIVLDISSNRLQAVFLRETGETNDCFTLIKTNFAPVVTNLAFAVAADTTATLTLPCSDPNRNPITLLAVAPTTFGLLSALDPAGLVTYTPARGNTNTDSFTFVATDGRLTSSPALATITLQPPSDTNNNGLSDTWEATCGVNDPDADPDGDGMTNLAEYYAGTNPTNALSCLRITQIAAGQSGFKMSWSAVGGTRYRVLYSEGDAQAGFTGLFKPIVRGIDQEMDPDPLDSPGTMSFADDFSLTGGSPASGIRYYRVQVVR